MSDRRRVLIQKFFEEKGFIEDDIKSFNDFIEFRLQKILEDNQLVEPTVIPPNVDDFKIRLDRIWVGKPEITEADGSKRPIYPVEARLRKLSYSAPIFVEVSSHVNGVQRESVTTQIGNLPIMLKSKYCHLHKMRREELIKHGEDPDDPGGYFIINGTEKVVIRIEDLAPNRFMVQKEATGTSEFSGKLFSERGSYKIPHLVEKLSDGVFYLSFTRVKRIPLVVVMKALGMLEDKTIMETVGLAEHPEVFINLYQFMEIKDEEEALDYMARKIGITQSREIRVGRMQEIIDRFLLPHIGLTTKDRKAKAINLCKYWNDFIQVSSGVRPDDDKDHYKNKRLKQTGDLLADLFSVNLKVLIGDLLYNFQRIVKRGKFPTIKVIIREKLLTQRIYSSMATGTWVGGRTGISQRMERLNFLHALSHLQRVVSPLSSSQENFEARALHATHLGRLCPLETPEGSNIGLRKNKALLSGITASEMVDNDELIRSFKSLGLETEE
ncbi:MAG: DNA-directed RNA polymerase subunit B'' [Candidatus Woesearchaeota archaeon]|nr:MAG: DNA-directed RNA polymerase subunit B'' [Candidatus Woesearchaeota archaeon]